MLPAGLSRGGGGTLDALGYADAYGTLSPGSLMAGGSALAASVGDATVNLTAGEDAALVTYGAFGGSVYAGRDVPFVGAVGDIGAA